MGDDELLPCPFCGGKVEWGDFADEKDYQNTLSCKSCEIIFTFAWHGARFKQGGYKDAFNARTPTAEVEKMILKQEYFKAGAKAFTDPNELYKIEFQDNLKFHFNAYEQSKREDDNG